MRKVFVLCFLGLLIVGCKTTKVTDEDKELSTSISNAFNNVQTTPNPGDNYYFANIVDLNQENIHPTLMKVSINKVINVYGDNLELGEDSVIDLINKNINSIYYVESNEVDEKALGQFYLYDINYVYDYKTNEEINDKIEFFYCFQVSEFLPGDYIIARDITKDKDYYDDFTYYDFAYMLYNNLEVIDDMVLLFDDREVLTFVYSKSFYEGYSQNIYDNFLIPDNFYVNKDGIDYYKINFKTLLDSLN